MIASYISHFDRVYSEHSTKHLVSNPLSYEAVLFLKKVKRQFPNHPWSYLQLGENAYNNGEFECSLNIYKELLVHFPNNKQGVLGVFKALLSLEMFDKAESFYLSIIDKISGPLLDYQTALLLMKISINTEAFRNFTSSDFSKLFFIKYMIHNNFGFVVQICKLLTSNSLLDYVLLAHEYVYKKGGRFVYITIDELFDVHNKSEAERKLLKEHIWEPGFQRIDWLQNCPNHVRDMYSTLPDFSESYIKEIFSGPVNHIQGTKVVMGSYSSEFVNIEDNLRVTTDQPKRSTNTVHLLGGSDVYGFGSEDKHTFASCLQRKLLNSPTTSTIKVKNYGIRGNPLPVLVSNLLQQPINQGDVVVVFGYAPIDVLPSYIENFHISLSRPHSFGELFFDHNHIGVAGNRVVADKVFKYLGESISTALPKPQNGQLVSQFTRTGINLIKYILYKKTAEICEVGELKTYIDYVASNKIDTIGVVGSVAVNCNPLTLGHLHLLEYASQNVDQLYIFVIEEDLSYFSFDTRIRLVREGTAHLDNVSVLQGGRYICTEFTYPEYYSKSDMPQVVADASMEAWFFCEFIAKELNITKIFLGDEPVCNVTKQYNIKMAELLPIYGIEVDIIPRISLGQDIISASVVRKYLECRDFFSIEKIVPECTYNYLRNEFSN